MIWETERETSVVVPLTDASLVIVPLTDASCTCPDQESHLQPWRSEMTLTHCANWPGPPLLNLPSLGPFSNHAAAHPVAPHPPPRPSPLRGAGWQGELQSPLGHALSPTPCRLPGHLARRGAREPGCRRAPWFGVPLQLHHRLGEDRSGLMIFVSWNPEPIQARSFVCAGSPFNDGLNELK